MRNKISTLLLVTALATTQTLPIMAETIYYDGQAHEYNLDRINLYVNGKEIKTIMPPVQLDNRVLVPSREVFDPMGAKVEWDNNSKRVKITYKSNTIILYVNKQTVTLNGKEVPIDVPPKIINNKVMIPVRFISENLGFTVDWNSVDRSVSINEPKTPDIDDEESNGSADKEYLGSKNQHKITLEDQNYEKTSITRVETNDDRAIIMSTTPISDVDILLHAGKVIIDIGNSKSELSSTINPTTNSYIKNIRTSQFESTTTRVVLDLKAGALVEASLNEDRTQLYINLKPRTVEKITYEQNKDKDVIFIEGIAPDQISIDKKDKQLNFIMPNSNIEKEIYWDKLEGSIVSAVKVNNADSDVKMEVSLKQEYQYDIVSDYLGTTVTIEKNKGDTEQPPTEDKLDNIVYSGGTKTQIELSNLTGIDSKQVVVTDDYRNRTLTFDLSKDYSDKLKNQTINIGDGKVKEIKISNDKTTKIIVKTNTVRSYYLNNTNSGIKIQIVKPSEKYEKIVVIDAGHGGTDSGAVGNGTNEKTINYNQSMQLYKALNQKSDIKVYMTRETDIYPTLSFRTTLANEIDADLFISVHNNSATSSARGAETLYFPSSTDNTGKKVAQVIQNALVHECGMLNRGIKARSDLYVLKNSSMPAVLIETGFISNSLDAAILKDDLFTKKWADSISDAIIEAFKFL